MHIKFQPSRLPRSDRFIQSLTLFKAWVSLVEISFHVEFHPPGLPRSGRFIHSLILFKAGGRGSGDPNFFLQISFSWVKMSFHVEFHPPGWPGTGLKVCVGGWFQGKFSVSFGPKLQFSLWIWTWTKLNNS